MVFFRHVVDGIYLGDFETARDRPLLDRYNVRGVLTVGSIPDEPHPDHYDYHHVIVEDDDEELLLHHFPMALAFIEGQLAQSRGILINCDAGIARCAAFAIAYLMKSGSRSLPDAVAITQLSHRDACPNEGFVAQLHLFHKMRFLLDMNNAEYRELRLAAMARERERYSHVSPALFYSDGDSDIAPDTPTTRVLRCRACTRPLLKSHAIIDHDASSRPKGFGWHKDPVGKGGKGVATCTSWFVEPMMWMMGEEGEEEGKITCPKCSAKLGSFSWVGSQCSCSGWVSPAFMIHKRAVDVIIPVQRPPAPPS